MRVYNMRIRKHIFWFGGRDYMEVYLEVESSQEGNRKAENHMMKRE
jgi:hypothetical protein